MVVLEQNQNYVIEIKNKFCARSAKENLILREHSKMAGMLILVKRGIGYNKQCHFIKF